ncbi:MAG: hypothetical protein IKB70_08125 [Bacilli bacterium]|nr:hypothetical protein [Bacilli bacterium]
MRRFISFLMYFIKYFIQIACAAGCVVSTIWLIIEAPKPFFPWLSLIPMSALILMALWWEQEGKYFK